MRMLLAEPRALLFDEPFSKLDGALRDDLRAFTFGHIRNRGIPALMVIHDPADASTASGTLIDLGQPDAGLRPRRRCAMMRAMACAAAPLHPGSVSIAMPAGCAGQASGICCALGPARRSDDWRRSNHVPKLCCITVYTQPYKTVGCDSPTIEMAGCMHDFYSDTQSRPTRAMREAALDTPLGDERHDADPSTLDLCARVAGMLGMEAAVFLPSGTMCNEIAIAVHTSPGDEVICTRESHIIFAESGGLTALSGVMMHPIDGEREC